MYDSTAGANTVVFSVGSGLTRSHEEFELYQITPDDIILAADVDPGRGYLAESDDLDGTWVASLIMGGTYGVSKRTKMRPVMINTSVGSLISALVEIGDNIFWDETRGPVHQFLASSCRWAWFGETPTG